MLEKTNQASQIQMAMQRNVDREGDADMETHKTDDKTSDGTLEYETLLKSHALYVT